MACKPDVIRECNPSFMFVCTSFEKAAQCKLGRLKTKITRRKGSFQPWYRVKIPEDAARGTDIIQVAATDDDAEENGIITYKFAPETPDELEIDQKTGKVTLKTELDRERKDVLRLVICHSDYNHHSVTP